MRQREKHSMIQILQVSVMWFKKWRIRLKRYRTSVTKKILEVVSNSVYSYGIIIQILKVLYNFQVETRLTSPFFPCIV